MEISLDLREAVRTQHEIDLETLEQCLRSLYQAARRLNRALVVEDLAEREVSGALEHDIDNVCDDLLLTADEVEELISRLVRSVTYHHDNSVNN